LPDCIDFAQIFNYLKHATLPKDDEAARLVMLESPNYVLQDDVLYHLFTPRAKKIERAFVVVRQLCIPCGLRESIASSLHDNNAHIGFDRLYAMARTRYHWPGMYTFLHDHVRTWLTCQMIKAPTHLVKTPVGALSTVPPGERWIVDFHGIFPASGSDDKRYILVFIDSASLWPEMVAVRDTSAENVVQSLFDCIISRWGFPKQIDLQSDNGSGFIAKLTDLCCRTFGITQCFSTPFRPQPQSKVESHAKVIHQTLKVLSTTTRLEYTSISSVYVISC